MRSWAISPRSAARCTGSSRRTRDWDDRRRDQHLRLEHLQAIAALVADTSWVSPILRGDAELRFRDRTASASLFGVGAEYPELWSLPVQAGRFLEQAEVRQRRKVVVLGDRIAHTLFDDPERAVGSVVSAGGLQLQVVGGDGSRLPRRQRRLRRPHLLPPARIVPHHLSLGFRPSARTCRPSPCVLATRQHLGESMARVQRFLDRVLPGSPSVRPFVVETDQARLATEAEVLRVITTVVTLVAGISLLVGGLGIMNIMLVSVSERTVEIGLRKAVGARDGDILGQFLIESVVICLLGGVCGVVLGFGGTLAVALALGWNLDSAGGGRRRPGRGGGDRSVLRRLSGGEGGAAAAGGRPEPQLRAQVGIGALIMAALAAVASNRFRTILALLGITIGVGSVIAIVGLGDGTKLVVRDAIARFGAGSLMVLPNYQVIEASDGRYDWPTVTREDIAQINAQADAVRAVTPQANWTGVSARHAGRVREVEIFGTLHHYLLVNSSTRLARGRFLHPEDDRLQRKVAVLGAGVAADLFAG